MARPTKCRRICHMPVVQEFVPNRQDGQEPVILSMDEYEAIRLMDKEGMSQQQCSSRMGVARTTVQKIYESARKKIAEMLVEGRAIRIEGGDVELCQGSGCEDDECMKRCGHACYCGRHCCHHVNEGKAAHSCCGR